MKIDVSANPWSLIKHGSPSNRPTLVPFLHDQVVYLFPRSLDPLSELGLERKIPSIKVLSSLRGTETAGILRCFHLPPLLGSSKHGRFIVALECPCLKVRILSPTSPLSRLDWGNHVVVLGTWGLVL